MGDNTVPILVIKKYRYLASGVLSHTDTFHKFYIQNPDFGIQKISDLVPTHRNRHCGTGAGIYSVSKLMLNTVLSYTFYRENLFLLSFTGIGQNYLIWSEISGSGLNIFAM
jgi:hypothetical protein